MIQLRHRNASLIALLTLLLSACASTPRLPVDGVNLTLQPADIVRATEQNRLQDTIHDNIMWGGLIVENRSLATHTQLEVLAYPLNTDQMPDTSVLPLGRFLADYQGFLEPLEFSAGRLLTLTGQITGSQQAQIQAAIQIYPTVRVQHIQLWPAAREQADDPQLRFGIGIGVIFH